MEKGDTNTDHKAPLVSLGVPVYNGAKYLAECLDSILDQTFQDWECVIVNNSSTDNTKEIALQYVARDARFTLHETSELLPITPNWNFCFSKTNPGSKYFKLILADDWIFREYLEKMVDVLEKHPEAGFCSAFMIDDTHVSCDGLDIYKGNLFNGKEILVKQLKGDLIVTGSANTILYNRSVLEQLSYFPVIYQADTFHMDTYLSYELLNMADMGFVFQVLSYTRRHNETVTKNVTNQLKTGFFFQERALFDFKEIDPELGILYKRLRSRYAYSLLKHRLSRNRKLVSWHTENLKRPITFGEYVTAVLKRIINRL
ncbi:MAG: glycosyltransferase family 2 protein [Bacteroidales bacterium]|nr:glycosyltransferase family 2 protein [Bacteroidales bacterium]